MNIIVNLTLVVCLLDLSVAARLRENLNVLVPSNEENLRAKIKTLLSGDEFNPDFSDSEIESLNGMKDPDIEKLRHKKMKNKINFDDKIDNFVDNQNDVEVPSVKEAISNFLDNSKLTTPPEFKGSPFTPTIPNNLESNSTPTLPGYGVSTFELQRPTFPQTLLSYNYPTNWTTPTPINTTSQLTPTDQPEGPTPVSTSSYYTNTTQWSNETTSNTTHYPYSTMNTTLEFTTYDRNTTTPSTSFNTSTTTLSILSNEPSPTTSNEPPSPAPDYPIFNDFHVDECLLGTAERYLLWLNFNGSLNVDYISSEYGNVNHTDLSRRFSSSLEYENYINSSNLLPSVSFNRTTWLADVYEHI